LKDLQGELSLFGYAKESRHTFSDLGLALNSQACSMH